MFFQAKSGLIDNACLAKAAAYPSMVVLLCTDKSIYLSGPGSIWEVAYNDTGPKLVAPLPAPWLYRQVMHWRHLRRLGRLDVREMIAVPGGGLLGIFQKQIIAINPASQSIHPVFQVPGGGRPRGFAIAASGHLFVGEYWGNPRRQPLRLWSSNDNGESWELAHTLAAGRAKHIHNIIWDEYRHGFWVLTGDSDDESALLFTADEFKTINEVIRGDQMVRACHLFCRPEGLYYGTDSERASNWFMHLELPTGRLQKIQALPGSCIYAARMADRYWLSTAVEPSKINHERRPALWFSTDLQKWTKLVDFQKDWWPGEYFGFGRVILPTVQGPCPVLAFSAVAVRRNDLSTFVLKPEVVQPMLLAKAG
jgi:hypothetical protein